VSGGEGQGAIAELHIGGSVCFLSSEDSQQLCAHGHGVSRGRSIFRYGVKIANDFDRRQPSRILEKFLLHCGTQEGNKYGRTMRAAPGRWTTSSLVKYSAGECANSLHMNSLCGFVMLYHTDALGVGHSDAGIAPGILGCWKMAPHLRRNVGNGSFLRPS
jgi:hypothetical protein